MISIPMQEHGKCLQKSGNKAYMMGFIERVDAVLDLPSIGVDRLRFRACGSRGFYSAHNRTVVLNPYSKSFSPDYRGYAFKKYGGRADLTPGGVFAHECGHGFFATYRQQLTEYFKDARKRKRKSITSYGTSCLEEDVAECFRLYTTNWQLLEQLDEPRFHAVDCLAVIHFLDVEGA